MGVFAIIGLVIYLSSGQEEQSPPQVIESEQEPKEIIVKEDIIEEKTEEIIVEDTKKEQEQVEEIEVQQQDLEQEEKKTEISFRNFPQTPIFVTANVDHQQLIEEYMPEEYREIDDQKQNVFLYANNGDSWLTLKVDDQEIRRTVLQNGRYLALSGELIKLFAGNTNALVIFYNGQVIDPQTSTGVKSFIFPQQRKSEFVLPLFIFPDSGETLTSKQYLERKAN